MSVQMTIERGEKTYTVEAEWQYRCYADGTPRDCADLDYDYSVYDEDDRPVAPKDYGFILKGEELDILLTKLYQEAGE